MSINSLKKIYLKACRLVSLTLPFVQHVPCTCVAHCRAWKGSPKITKALYLELLMVFFTVNSRFPLINH